MEYIKSKRPELLPLYTDIYAKGNNAYWQALDGELRAFAKEQGLEYKDKRRYVYSSASASLRQ